ncbi:MAG: hypothetical protein ABIA74_02080 [bacterium]
MKKLLSAFFLFSLVLTSNVSFVRADGSDTEKSQNLVQQLEQDKEKLSQILTRYDEVIKSLQEKSGKVSESDKKDIEEVLTKYEKLMKVLAKVKIGSQKSAKVALNKIKDFMVFAANKNNEVFSIRMLIVYVFLAGQVYGASTAVFGHTIVDSTLGYLFLPFFKNTFALLGVISIYAKIGLEQNADTLKEFAMFMGFLVNSIMLKFKAGLITGVLSSIFNNPFTAIYVYGIDAARFGLSNFIKGLGIGSVVSTGKYVVSFVY